MMTRCDLIAGFARHAAVAKSAKGFSTVPHNPAYMDSPANASD